MRCYRYTVLTCAVMFSFSCGNDPRENVLDSTQQEMVINGPDPFDVTEQVEQHTHTIATDDTNRLLEYRKMSLMNSSVLIRSSRALILNEKCHRSSGLASNTSGSGNLTSPSRLVTAHHVVEATIENRPYFYVYFDSSGARVGTSAPMESIKIPFTRESGEPYNENYKFVDENPLLANRLFSLGLGHWSEFQKYEEGYLGREDAPHGATFDLDITSPRIFLRRWHFEMDESVESQEFLSPTMTPEGIRLDGRDIAILRSVSRDNVFEYFQEHWNNDKSPIYLPTGAFKLNAPGPFFNTARVNPAYSDTGLDLCNTDSDENYPEYGSYFHRFYTSQNFSDDPTFGNIVPKKPIIVSGYNMGPVGRDWADGIATCYFSTNNTVAYAAAGSKFSNNHYTSLDILKSSSGGGLVDGTCEYAGSGRWDADSPLHHDLVLKGVAQSGVDDTTANWHTTIRTTILDPWNLWDPVSLAWIIDPDELSDTASRFVQHDNHSFRWSRRDIDWSANTPTNPIGNPFTPTPSQPIEDGCPGDLSGGTEPQCLFIPKPGKSTRYTDINLSSIVEHVVPIGSNIPDPVGHPQTPAVKVDGAEYELLKCPRTHGDTTVLVDNEKELYSRPWRVPVAQIQGVVGGSTHNLWDKNDSLNEETEHSIRVGSLGQICVPWGSDNWLNNWTHTWLGWEGWTRTFFDMDDITGVQDANHQLRDFLALAYEARWVGEDDKRERQYRPPSMKTCPPNYYVNGIEFRASSEEDDAEIIGITALECVLHKKYRTASSGEEPTPWYQTPPATWHRAPLMSHSKHNGFKWSGEKSDAQDFSLDQFIGYPHLPNGSSAPTSRSGDGSVESITGLDASRCESQDEVVVSIAVRRTLDNTINGMHVICLPAPGTQAQ